MHLNNYIWPFSNGPPPNRAGYFHSTRLSRCVLLPIGPHVPSGTAFGLRTSPCGPSPCLRHYPQHLSTMATPSPYTSRWVGDPAVPASLSSVRRCPIGWFPRSLRALTEEAFPHPSSLDAELRTSPTSTMNGRGHATSPAHLGFGSRSLTIYGITARPLGRVLPAPYFPTMLVFPLSFDIRLGGVLTTSAPVVLGFPNKKDANTAAHFEARPSNRRWSQECRRGRAIFRNRSSRVEVKAFPWQFFRARAILAGPWSRGPSQTLTYKEVKTCCLQ